MSKVKLEVVQVPASRMDVKSGKKFTKKILPGVSHALAPGMDRYGRVVTGCTEEEYDEIMEGDLGVSEPLSYPQYFRNFCVKVTADGKELNLEIPEHQLIYRFLKTLPEVAKSKKLVNSSVHNFYLIDEEAEAEKQLSEIDFKMKAYSYLNDMSAEDIIEFLVLYGKEYRNVSPSLAKAKLGELIETNPERFITLYQDNSREVKIKLRMLQRIGIIRKEGPAYFYGAEGDAIMLGASEELAIAFLSEMKNQELYISLIKML